MQKTISIELTQEEINVLSLFLEECADVDCDHIDEDKNDILCDAVRKILDKANPEEDETVILPESIFPPGFADHLCSFGFAEKVIQEIVKKGNT